MNLSLRCPELPGMESSMLMRVVGGLLFVVAGVLRLVGAPYLVVSLGIATFIGLILLVIGAVILTASAIPGVSAGSAVVLALGLLALLLSTVQPAGIQLFKHYERSYLVTTADVGVPVERLEVDVRSTTGHVTVEFSGNESVLLGVQFRWWWLIWWGKEPTLNYSVKDGVLQARVDAYMSNVHVTLPKAREVVVRARSTTGGVDIAASGAILDRVEVSTTTGDVDVGIEDSALSTLSAVATTGDVTIKVREARPPSGAGSIAVSATTGDVTVELVGTGNVSVKASTSTGSIDVTAPPRCSVVRADGSAVVSCGTPVYSVDVSTSTGDIRVRVS